MSGSPPPRKAPRGALDIDERHPTNAGKLSPENTGRKSPLILRQIIIGSPEGRAFGTAWRRIARGETF